MTDNGKTDTQIQPAYGKQWDQFYHSLNKDGTKKALWDVDPQLAVAQDLAVMDKWMDSGLGMIDMGCGTGARRNFSGDSTSR